MNTVKIIDVIASLETIMGESHESSGADYYEMRIAQLIRDLHDTLQNDGAEPTAEAVV